MILFPAIDLKDGTCVRLEQGEMDRATVFSDRPGDMAARFAALGFAWLHVVDLDGAFAGESRNAAAVAACMLDWEGRTLDFVGGAVNFEGKGFQLDYGASRDRLLRTEKPLLFACGGAMLVDRSVFIEAGGWDDDAFAYYEDVELGWRLNLLGHEVWFCPDAIVYHKHHGTSGQWAEPPRTLITLHGRSRCGDPSMPNSATTNRHARVSPMRSPCDRRSSAPRIR